MARTPRVTAPEITPTQTGVRLDLAGGTGTVGAWCAGIESTEAEW